MPKLLCWLFHRTRWTILIPGSLPGHLDAIAWCPACDGGSGHRARTPLLLQNLPAGA